MASEAPKARFVRCPKCRRLLMEVADVPVYKCGGCGAILQAKIRHANNMETGDRGGHVAVLFENPPCSNSENNPREEESNCSEEAESTACKESVDMEASSTSEFPNFTEQSAGMGEDAISMPCAPQSQADASWKLSQHGSVNSISSNKMVESTETVVSEEEIFDGNPGNGQLRNVGTPIARSSHASDSGVSSGDDISGKHQKYRLLSRRTFRNRKLSEPNRTGTKDGKEDTFVGNKQIVSPGVCDASAHGISGLKQRSSSRNAAQTSDPYAYSDTENPCPLGNELESDHLSRSPSRHSSSLEDFPCDRTNSIPSTRLGNLEHDRMKIPSRVDLPRDHLTRLYAGGRGVGSVPVEGISHDGHRPSSSSLETEAVVTPFYDANTPPWRSRASEREMTARRYQSSGIPFSGQGSGSCLHHHHPKPCNTPAQLPSSIYCRGCSSHTSFRPSAAAGSGCPGDRGVTLYHNSETSDQGLRKLPFTEKRQRRRRRHCRPVAGGAPFVVCNSCLELLQPPADFLVSTGRRHKLRCGACSEVLTFLYLGGHVVPHRSAQLDPSSGEFNQSQDSLQEDPVSYTEGYGPPPSQSYSTDGQPVPCILRSCPEQKGKGSYRQIMGPPLHHLMGYDSARDLIYVPSDEDETYEVVDMSRFYRTSDDTNFDGGFGGTGTSSPPQRHSALGYSPNHSEIQEEDEPAMRLPGARGAPPLRGFFREDTDELNDGLANMKLRPQKNGRPW